MQGAFAELEQAERIYRDSIPDITHNHLLLFYSGRLWSTMTESAVTGWQVRNIVDQRCAESLRGSRIFTVLFAIIGLIPFLGKFIRRLWGRADYRRHYGQILSSRDYFGRAVRGRMAEKLIAWHRAGRVNDQRALILQNSTAQFFGHLMLSLLPASLHRFFTDSSVFKEKLKYIFVRPFRLLFRAAAREQWLREMIENGQKNHLITDEDANLILSQINERFIQVYLISMAVHVLTLPITQVVAFFVGLFLAQQNPELSGAGKTLTVGGTMVLFQITPISPGSIVRGLYVLGLVIYERNIKDYKIAICLGFFKYIGYLSFPIQMAYRYPVLARFMAAHWATGAVHVVPVFGESGALLEHGVFSLFYNWPLTIRQQMQRRAQVRITMEKRSWHVWVCAAAAALLLAAVDQVYLSCGQMLPGLMEIWWLTIMVPLVAGSAVTLGAGGTVLPHRIIQGAMGGVAMAIIYVLIRAGMNGDSGEFFVLLIWRVFIFAIFSTIGVIVTELKLGETQSF